MIDTIRTIRDAVAYQLEIQDRTDIWFVNTLRAFKILGKALNPSELSKWVEILSAVNYGRWVCFQAFPMAGKPLAWEKIEVLMEQGEAEGLN